MSDTRAPVDVEQQPSHAAPLGRMRPKRERRATHLLPEHETAVAKGRFFVRGTSHLCAGLSPAQRDFSRRFVPCPSSGGGGNRTRVRGRTGQNLYKRSPRFSFGRRPGADALPTA